MKALDKVKCLDGDFSSMLEDRTVPKEYRKIKTPKEGKKYTVREIVDTEVPGEKAVRLIEIKNKKIYHSIGGWREPAFALKRFKVIK